MSIRTKLVIVWLSLIATTCWSVSEDNGFSSKDGAFYIDDAVVINGKRIYKILLSMISIPQPYSWNYNREK